MDAPMTAQEAWERSEWVNRFDSVPGGRTIREVFDDGHAAGLAEATAVVSELLLLLWDAEALEVENGKTAWKLRRLGWEHDSTPIADALRAAEALVAASEAAGA